VSESETPTRRGEYGMRGEYHRALDPTWDYLPTYLAKMTAVRRYLDALPAGTRVLDAGCGEGVLVDAYAERLAIEGLDHDYSSARVRQGSLTALPYDAGRFDRILCLDVLEHLPFPDQAAAIQELHRVLRDDGEALLSIPNLAHLQSRLHFLASGRLMRTANIAKHPGDRPIGEYVTLLERAGFVVTRRQGIFPTLPVLTALVRRHPSSMGWLHRLMTRLLPVPGWCFLNLLWIRKKA